MLKPLHKLLIYTPKVFLNLELVYSIYNVKITFIWRLVIPDAFVKEWVYSLHDHCLCILQRSSITANLR